MLERRYGSFEMAGKFRGYLRRSDFPVRQFFVKHEVRKNPERVHIFGMRVAFHAERLWESVRIGLAVFFLNPAEIRGSEVVKLRGGIQAIAPEFFHVAVSAASHTAIL